MPIAPRRSRMRAFALVFLAALLGLPFALLTPAVALADLAIGGKAIVVTTEGDRLTVRSGAGPQFAPVGSLAEGVVVTILAGPQSSADGTVWLRVQGGGITGWCSAEWLADPATVTPVAPPAPTATPPPAPAPTATPPPAPAATPPPAPPDPGSSVTGGGTPRIGNTGGRGARLRAEPSLKAATLLVVPDGAAVELVGASRAAEGYEWLQVRYNDATGWVASSLLTANIARPAPTPVAPAATPPPAAAPAPAASPAAPPAPSPAPAPANPAAGNVVPGDRATVIDTDGYELRIRSRPGLDAPIVAYIPAGTVVTVTAGPQLDTTGAPWFGIDHLATKGWVLGEHLARGGAAPPAPSSTPSPMPAPAPAPAPRENVPASPPPAPTARPQPSAAPLPVAPAAPGNRGAAVASTALRYLGVPYVYGGATPSGWDCSGFVSYIYQQAAGVTLPRSAAQQYRVGTSIGKGQVEAGDIIFFSDTFGPGITHNGIALGDGRFIHARSEGYGTVISSLTDPYWAEHYAGARRP